MKQEIVLTIAGSRGFTDKQHIHYHANQYISHVVTYIVPDIDSVKIVIQSGMAKGSPDEVAVKYAEIYGYELREFPYPTIFGKSGGPIRNDVMAEKTDYALVFWDGQSKGTRNFIECLMRHKKPFQVNMVNANLVTNDDGAAQSSFDL